MERVKIVRIHDKLLQYFTKNFPHMSLNMWYRKMFHTSLQFLPSVYVPKYYFKVPIPTSIRVVSGQISIEIINLIIFVLMISQWYFICINCILDLYRRQIIYRRTFITKIV